MAAGDSSPDVFRRMAGEPRSSSRLWSRDPDPVEPEPRAAHGPPSRRWVLVLAGVAALLLPPAGTLFYYALKPGDAPVPEAQVAPSHAPAVVIPPPAAWRPPEDETAQAAAAAREARPRRRVRSRAKPAPRNTGVLYIDMKSGEIK